MFVIDSLENQKGKINDLNDREAMGLPNYFISNRLEGLHLEINSLSQYTVDELILTIENYEESLLKRYASGTLLGMRNDPRIDTFNPKMIKIPGGEVTLGLDSSKVEDVVKKYAETGIIHEWIKKETPEYKVVFDSYKIAKFPVTNKEYLQFLIENPHNEIPSSWINGVYPFYFANHPAYTVSAEAADNYVKWLSKKTKREIRLPTEAEWEYAASGPNGNEFPWGDEYLDDHANVIETGIVISSPVGMFTKGDSYFGISDMAGNVEEFVSDYYVPYPGGEEIADDLADTKGTYRIARGGGFTRFKDLARCKRRHGHFPRDIYVMGFRLAENLLR